MVHLFRDFGRSSQSIRSVFEIVHLGYNTPNIFPSGASIMEPLLSICPGCI